mmetsp:Transcript_23663/g.34431  ORF Transcript_23663/g.34431 Transcript_23663/m.34431 type:complete len:224 (-) Transcript_23663:945-1616(-)
MYESMPGYTHNSLMCHCCFLLPIFVFFPKTTCSMYKRIVTQRCTKELSPRDVQKCINLFWVSKKGGQTITKHTTRVLFNMIMNIYFYPIAIFFRKCGGIYLFFSPAGAAATGAAAGAGAGSGTADNFGATEIPPSFFFFGSFFFLSLPSSFFFTDASPRSPAPFFCSSSIPICSRISILKLRISPLYRVICLSSQIQISFATCAMRRISCDTRTRPPSNSFTA